MPERLLVYVLRGVVVVLVVAGAALAGFFLFREALLPAPQGGEGGHQHAGAAGGSFFGSLFKVYTPRQVCMFHEAPVVWLHLVSDLLIGIAYFSIPVALVSFVRRRRDIAFHWIFWMFAAFILACGTTHFVGVWDLWQPMYKVDGLVKAGTAAISVATAVTLWPLIPKALALPSPAQLEHRVAERTAELARANEALHAARSEAERASRMKDEFLATLSHELRTPLQAVLGWSSILQTSSSPERLAEGLSVITRNAQAQTKLIEDLLDMSRITSGRLRLGLQTVDLTEVVRAAVESAQPAADAKEIRLQTILDSAAGPVTGDPARLQQVVWNLLSNAVKFTPKGGSIQVLLERVDSHVELSVVDNGEGIEPDFVPQLFQRFRQADASASRRYGGLGIGLALVRHIVELHGGAVRAHSAGKDQGATFVVLLPLRAAAAERRADRPSAPTATAPAPASRMLDGVSVLAIDDEPDARRLIEAVLGDAGATVVAAGAAAEAIEHLRREKFDVLLCDLGLPGEDGFSLIRRVRALPADGGGLTPAVAVTAFARSEDRTRALLAGFQVHVVKPFDADDLIATIAGLAGLRGRGGLEGDGEG